MTREQTAEVVAVVRMLWPHSKLGGDPGQVVGLWHSLLGAFDARAVEAAVRELAAAGREHAPPVGVVVKVTSDRAVDAPDWDEAWAEIDRLIRRFGSYERPDAAMFSHPLIAAFALPAWLELCGAPAPGVNGHGTHYAQQREAYRAMRYRSERDTGLAAIGARRRAAPRQLSEAFGGMLDGGEE